MKVPTITVGLVLGFALTGFGEGGPAATTTTLATSNEGAFTTQPPVFTATVETQSSTPAGGTVEFVADGVPFGEAPVFTRDGHRIAVMGGATLAVGVHAITARYGGDDSHLPSESAALLQEIAQGDYFAFDLTPGITSRVTATGVNGAGQVIGAAPLFLDGQLAGYLGLLYDQGLHFLPLLGGTSTVPLDLNDTGTIVGSATVASGATHAFLDKDAHITDLGTLDGGSSQALAINATGQVVGIASTASGHHGFLYQSGTLADLGTLGGAESAALAVNSSGMAAGYADLESGERHAACYASSWIDLGTLGGTQSVAVAVNDAGQVAGSSTLAGDADVHAFLWQEGHLADLVGAEGPSTQAAAINDAGQVVGSTVGPSDAPHSAGTGSPRNAFLYSGALTVLGTLGGGTSQAVAISNAGLLVGASDGHAFVSAGGALRDLGTLGGATSQARAVNDKGLIVGDADLASGLHHAVAWIPVRVPTLAVAPAVGRAGGTTVLAARLTLSGSPVPGQRIDFALGGTSVGSALSNATGTATLSGVSLAAFAAGTYPAAVRAAHAASITVGAADGTADLIVAPDHPPVAADDSYVIAGRLSVPAPGVLYNDADPDGDAISAVLVSGPAHGSVALAADGSFVYTPSGAAVGDSFTYRAVAAGLSSNVATVSLTGVVVPTFGGIVSAPTVTVSDSVDTKRWLRLDGDLLAYAEGVAHPAIHYYEFGTGQGAVIPPGAGNFDLTPDVSQGRIVFLRQAPSLAWSVQLFDVATSELTPIAPGSRPDAVVSGIGGDTVAYGDSGDGWLYVWDLPTSTATRLAPYVDFIDGSVRISPDGNTVVLAYCPYCDVLQAHRSGGVWVTSPVTSTLTRVERNPDTDGDWVLYQVNFPPNYSSSHLFLRPVTGGPETTLAIPGNQADPSIDAGVITFDSAAALGGAGDIFVYVLATNTLYQVTNTPEESEVAGDVSVLPNGDIRVAWTAGVGRQVRAMTFTPSH